MRNSKSLFAATFIFLLCLCLGFWKAQHKALWNDEFYSQVSSINNTSYRDQLLGRIPEGGNAPLFYASQKFFLKIIHFQTPSSWIQGHWQTDASSQILLRITPVILMSLSVCLVFHYFLKKFSLGAAFLSFFIYISSYMLWAYWAESRPYALLVFLTTVQSIILLNRVDQKSNVDNSNAWVLLAGMNILLSLTSILSLGEIGAASILWWILKEHDWKKYILVTLLPMAIAVFYYAHAPRYQFYFGLSPEQLIRDNITRQRFDILFIFLVVLSVYFVGPKNQVIRFTPGKEILKPVPYIIFMVLVLASSAAVLYIFALHAVKPEQGFAITSRYFIYLTPIGVIAATILSVSIVKSLSNHHLIRWILIGLIGFLLAQNFLKIVPKAVHSIVSG